MSPGEGLSSSIESSLQELVQRGRSLSGREPHCCFLNINNERFADVSAISGLNFTDDGRATSVVDWDLDGDLDFWVVNRSGPQVRYLRNEFSGDHHYLALRLQGTSGNRDAIGARVEVYLTGDANEVPLMKTLRAGNGFLAQSSKSVHFGLGKSADVKKIVVRWPGGEAEEFLGCSVDRRYQLVEGTGEANAWQPTIQPGTLEAAPLATPKSATPPRVVLSQRYPLPPLVYDVFGKEKTRLEADNKPLLIVFWASWCQPCLLELGEVQKHLDDFTKAGVDVVAVSLDGLEKGKPDAEKAELTLRRLGLSMPAGITDSETIDKLQILYEVLFDRYIPIAVPHSVLVDSKDQISVVYRGRVTPQQVLEDVELLSLRGEDLLAVATPFPGRWREFSEIDRLLEVSKTLLEEHFVGEASLYVVENEDRLAERQEYAGLQLYVADHMFDSEQFKLAAQWCQRALKTTPNYADAHHMLGLAQSKLGQVAESVKSFRKALEDDPDKLKSKEHLALILATSTDPDIGNTDEAARLADELLKAKGKTDTTINTIAAAYAANGRFDDAVEVVEVALKTAEDAGVEELVKMLKVRLEAYRNKRTVTDSEK